MRAASDGNHQRQQFVPVTCQFSLTRLSLQYIGSESSLRTRHPVLQSTMSGNKAALKAAKVALDAENYDDAVTQCQIVLASDSQNYFA
jgi:predicted negative regulator of RcsB-dependent stress response